MSTKIPLPSTVAAPFLTPRSGAQVFHRRIVVPLPMHMASALRLSTTNGSAPPSPPQPQVQEQRKVVVVPVAFVRIGALRSTAATPPAPAPARKVHDFLFHRTTSYPFSARRSSDGAALTGEAGAVVGFPDATSGVAAAMVTQRRCASTSKPSRQSSKRKSGSKKGSVSKPTTPALTTAQMNDPRKRSRSGGVDFSDFDPFGADVESGATVHDIHHGEGDVESVGAACGRETVEASVSQVSWVGRDGIERTRNRTQKDRLHHRLHGVLFDIRRIIRDISTVQKTVGRAETLSGNIAHTVGERRHASAEFARRLGEVTGEAEDQHAELLEHGFLLKTASGAVRRSVLNAGPHSVEPGLADTFTPPSSMRLPGPVEDGVGTGDSATGDHNVTNERRALRQKIESERARKDATIGTAMSLLGHDIEDEEDAEELRAFRRAAVNSLRLQKEMPVLKATRWAPTTASSDRDIVEQPDSNHTSSDSDGSTISEKECEKETKDDQSSMALHEFQERFRAARAEYDAALAEVQRLLDSLRLLAGPDVVALVRAESLVPTAPILRQHGTEADTADDGNDLLLGSNTDDEDSARVLQTAVDIAAISGNPKDTGDEVEERHNEETAESEPLKEGTTLPRLRFCGLRHAQHRLAQLHTHIFFDLFFAVTAQHADVPAQTGGDDADPVERQEIEEADDLQSSEGQSVRVAPPKRPALPPSLQACTVLFPQSKPLHLTPARDESKRVEESAVSASGDHDLEASGNAADHNHESRGPSDQQRRATVPPLVPGEMDEVGTITLLQSFLRSFTSQYHTLFRRSVRLGSFQMELQKEERELKRLVDQKRLVQRMVRERELALASEDEIETTSVPGADGDLNPLLFESSEQVHKTVSRDRSTPKKKSIVLAIEMDIRLQIASQTADDTDVWLHLQQQKISAQRRLVKSWEQAVWQLDGQYSKSVHYDVVLALSRENMQRVARRARMLTYILDTVHRGRQCVKRPTVLQELGKCVAAPLFDMRLLRASKRESELQAAHSSKHIKKHRGVTRVIGGTRWSQAPGSGQSPDKAIANHRSGSVVLPADSSAAIGSQTTCEQHTTASGDEATDSTDVCRNETGAPESGDTEPSELFIAEADAIAARSLQLRRKNWSSMVDLFRVLTTAAFEALVVASHMSIATLHDAVAAHIGVLRAAAPLCITGEQACTLLHLRSPRLRGFLLSHMTRLTHRSELRRKKSATERIAAREAKEKLLAEGAVGDSESTPTVKTSGDSGAIPSIPPEPTPDSCATTDNAPEPAASNDQQEKTSVKAELELYVLEASAVLPRLTPHEAITGLECIHRERLRFRFIEDRLYARYVEREKREKARDDMAHTEDSKRRERLIAAANNGHEEESLSAAAADKKSTAVGAEGEEAAAVKEEDKEVASDPKRKDDAMPSAKWKTHRFATSQLGLTGIRHMHTVGTGLTTKAGKLLRVMLVKRRDAEALARGESTAAESDAASCNDDASLESSRSDTTAEDHAVDDEDVRLLESQHDEGTGALLKYTPEQLMCLILSVCAATTAVSEARRLFARHMNDILPRMDPSDAARVARELIHTKGMAGFCAPYLIQHALADGNVQKLDPAAAAAAVEVITLMQHRSSKKENESVTRREKDLPCISFPDVKIAEHRIAMRRLFLHCTHLTCGARGLTRDEAAVLCSSLFKARALAPWSAVLLSRRTLCKALSHRAQATASSEEPGILNLRLAQMSKRRMSDDRVGLREDDQAAPDYDAEDGDEDERAAMNDIDVNDTYDVQDDFAWRVLHDVIAAERSEDAALRHGFELEATLRSAVADGWRPLDATGLMSRESADSKLLTATTQPLAATGSRWRRHSTPGAAPPPRFATRKSAGVSQRTPYQTKHSKRAQFLSKRALAFQRVSSRLRWERDRDWVPDYRRPKLGHRRSHARHGHDAYQTESESPWPLSRPDLTPKHLQKAMFFKKPELCAARDPALVRAVCDRLRMAAARVKVPTSDHIGAIVDMLWVLARAVEIEKARAIKARVAADNAPRTFQNSSYRSSNGRVKDGMGGSAPDSAAAALLTKHSAVLRLAVLEEHNGGFPITSLMGAGGDARPNRPSTPSSSPSSSNSEQVSATASLCGVPPSTNHSETTGTGTYARRVRAHFQELDAEIASGGAISKATMAEYHQLVMAQAQYETDHLSSGELTAQIVEVAPRIVPLLRKGLANITPYQAFVLCRVLPVLRVDDLSLGLALVHKAMSKRRRHTSMLLPPIDSGAEREALATGTSIVDGDHEDGKDDDATVIDDGQVSSIRETDGRDDEVATASRPTEDQAMRADEGRYDDASMAATPSLSMPLPVAPRSGFYRAAARAADPSVAAIPIAGPHRGEGSLSVSSPLTSEQAELNDADGVHEPIVMKQSVLGELKAQSKEQAKRASARDGSKTHHQRSIEAEKDRQRALEAGLLPDDSHALPRHSLYDVAVMTHALVSFGARDDVLEGHLQEHALHAVGLEL